MSEPRQQTVAGASELEGVGIHTGEPARIRFLSAEVDTGIRFRRTDLDGDPEIVASLEAVRDTELGTTLAADGAEARTVEHVLSAVAALGIDNLVIEMTGPEVPILDGSFRPFLDVLREAGIREQDRPARVWEISR
ncbi:MAG: hypothetical protein GWM90_09090, partial [Gemmatimonadetes bacterium]|nr:hypothetical protein [Gemmatimonadota bacterium]NIQ54055.1 hypothetical protein [Gemmatimonadota bacterium]NIU74243.1 hypothetical protein [Gammaproteobacteria bacterium]NIX44265.1 hypothetical protein [Gemmatimonadota bacterium]NIY08479.1 hypothetical protein [Gemmatimonadota bacterium]